MKSKAIAAMAEVENDLRRGLLATGQLESLRVIRKQVILAAAAVVSELGGDTTLVAEAVAMATVKYDPTAYTWDRTSGEPPLTGVEVMVVFPQVTLRGETTRALVARQ